MLGEVLAEAGLDAGFEVSWLPSYGPEMRSGTSNCHVRLLQRAHRFAAGLQAQCAARAERAVAAQIPRRSRARRLGSSTTATLCPTASPADVDFIVQPFTELADRLGDARAGNIVMLGALLETATLLDETMDRRRPPAPGQIERWLDLDRRSGPGRAIACAQHENRIRNPNTIVWFNNRFVPLAEANVNILTHALQLWNRSVRGHPRLLRRKAAGPFPRPPRRTLRSLEAATAGILRIDIPRSPQQLARADRRAMPPQQFPHSRLCPSARLQSSARIGVAPDDNDAFAMVVVPFGDYLDSRQGSARRRRFLAPHRGQRHPRPRQNLRSLRE